MGRMGVTVIRRGQVGQLTTCSSCWWDAPILRITNLCCDCFARTRTFIVRQQGYHLPSEVGLRSPTQLEVRRLEIQGHVRVTSPPKALAHLTPEEFNELRAGQLTQADAVKLHRQRKGRKGKPTKAMAPEPDKRPPAGSAKPPAG
jgi:hypothetical protein